MQPVEKVNKLFIGKLLLLSTLLYLGFVVKVPQFVKPTHTETIETFANPTDSTQEPKQIQKLYYRLVSLEQPEEIAI